MSEIPKSCAGCALYCRDGFFCSVLSDEALAALAKESTLRNLRTGETVMESALNRWPVIGIADGIIGAKRVQSDGRGSIAAFFVPGDIVDLRGAPERLRSELTALTTTEICHLSPEVFDRILASCPEARDIAWNSLKSQNFRGMEYAAELPMKRAPERLAWFICEFRHLHGEGPEQGPLFRLPFRQVDIADYLGIQPETISRSLRSLEELGAIHVRKAKLIEIIDQELLKSIASRSHGHVGHGRDGHEFRVLRAI